MIQKIRVVLADDHPIFRAGLRGLIEAEDGFVVVGEAASGAAALTVIREKRPDVAVADISMPGLSGIGLTKRVAEECPSSRVLLLTLHEDRAYVNQALQVGAAGYLLKRSAAENIIQAIRVALAGGLYMDPTIADRSLGTSRRSGAARSPEAGAAVLTEREAEVLKLIALGETNKAIARRFNVSVKTIETFKSRAAGKMGLKTRAEIVRYAAAIGWFGDC